MTDHLHRAFITHLHANFDRHLPHEECEELREAFYSGAQCLLLHLKNGFDNSASATPQDVQLIQEIFDELETFDLLSGSPSTGKQLN